MQVVSFLQHEQQLGERLNKAVVSAQRADFALMLAMLSQNVLEHSQFKLPEANALKSAETEQQLRARLAVNPPQALAITKTEQYHQQDQAQFLPEQLSTIRLKQLIENLPLAERNDQLFINDDIWQNTSIDCQYRHGYKKTSIPAQQSESPSKRASFNSNDWLDTVIPNSRALETLFA